MKKIIVVFAVCFLSAALGMQIERSMNADYTCNTEPITVVEGDTLWDLVNTHCEGARLDAVDDAVDKYGSDLSLWDIVYLPANNNCTVNTDAIGDASQDC